VRGTIRVDVRFFATVRALTNEYHVAVSLPEKSSVLDLLHALVGRYSDEFSDYIFEDDDRLNKYVVIIKNGRGVGILDGPGTLLNDGDSVSIMPAVGGG
jgi:MoaD family protein